MRKFKSGARYVIYELKAKEMNLFGSPGICDSCCVKPDKGFLIVVMNTWKCPECYENWDKTSRYYPEDAHIERRNEQYYDHVFM